MIGMLDGSEGANIKNSTNAMVKAFLWIISISSLGSIALVFIYFVILPSKWVFFIGCPFFVLVGVAGAFVWFRTEKAISKKT